MRPASIIIPTRERLNYLEVALASIAPQASAAGAEVLVIDDAGTSSAARALAERFGARYEPHPAPVGLNAARNTGVERSSGDLLVFVDDDVRASPGWLQALINAAREHPLVDVFTGPIRPRLEGAPPRSCGRESAPITSLDLGAENTPTRYAWGANMAIRRSALERIGPFDVTLEHGGDEQEWQDRLIAASAGDSPSEMHHSGVLYVADAAVDHRRVGADARLGSLARTAYARGRAARRLDVRHGRAPTIGRELATLAGCLGHVIRRRCPAGLTMVAHSAGRLREGLYRRHEIASGPAPAREVRPAPGSGPITNGRESAHRSSDDFLSGQSGTVGGLDALRRGVEDEMVDVWELTSGRRLRLELAARHRPPLRRVLVLGVVRPERDSLAEAMRAELLSSRHDVELHTCAPGERGKFENLNRLLAEHPPGDHDCLLVIDDDVELSHRFVDRFLFLCERFSLQLAQPAHRLNSHAGWPQTRRRARSVVRETSFVEIGPVTGFARVTFPAFCPFPSCAWAGALTPTGRRSPASTAGAAE